MIKIMGNVRTDELLPGDIVVHTSGDIGVLVKTDTSDLSHHGYAYLWWADQPGNAPTWSTTAQLHNVWDSVIRPKN